VARRMPTSRPRAKARFGPPPSVVVVENVTPETKPAPAKTRREKKKADPKLVAAARELRDRWLEHVNAGETLIEGAAKYDVSRVIAAPPASIDRKALPHAARAA